MWIVKGNKKIQTGQKEFNGLTKGFETVIVDLGTGDGGFVYKNALENPKSFYIGIDPAEKQLKIYSKKAVRKKLKNVLFVVGSVEQIPNELNGRADYVYINFPWGTLLETVAKPIEENVNNIKGILKPEGQLEIVFGYSLELEPSETERLELPEIDTDYIRAVVVPSFKIAGFELKDLEEFDNNEEKLETTWNRRVGKEKREFFKIVFQEK